MNNTCFKVKIGQYEHLKLLQSEGHVYCNSLTYFTKIEDDSVRSDKHEDAFEFESFNNPKLQIKLPDEPDSMYKNVDVTWVQLVKRYSNALGNLFCLYCVDMTNAKDEGQIFVDEKNILFGSHALIMLDTDEFEKRLYSELERKGLKYHFGHINYIDLKNLSGRKTLFQKDKCYSYQNEFRIFIENNSQEPLSVKIGDISDISRLIDFKAFIKIRYKRP